MIAIKNKIQAQADFYTQVREFFKSKNILEVQTPIAYPAPVTDPYIDAFEINYLNKKLYLQTSPEYAMKRLLAQGSGPIYQICKAFRDEGSGKFHNPEFLMLEWYRPGFSEENLITELNQLLQFLIKTPELKIKTYKACFEEKFNFNPHQISLAELIQLNQEKNYVHVISSTDLSKDDYLNLLFTHHIEKTLGQDGPVIINNFPVTQAALAKHKLIDGDLVAGRFELYYQGLELANAYDEQTDSQKLKQQFEQDLLIRKSLGLKPVPIDQELLTITDQLPSGCGIALGLDRLMMLALGLNNLQELLFFPV